MRLLFDPSDDDDDPGGPPSARLSATADYAQFEGVTNEINISPTKKEVCDDIGRK